MLNTHDGSSRPSPHLNEGCTKGFSESAPEVSTCEDISLCRSVNITFPMVFLLTLLDLIQWRVITKNVIILKKNLVFVIGILPLCVLDNYRKTCRMIKCLIIFATMSMGIHAAALIFWIWTGFLHLGILVKMSCVKGICIVVHSYSFCFPLSSQSR